MHPAFIELRRQPAPDLWPEIERRIEGQPAAPQPPGHQRLLAIVVAFALAAGAVTGLWLTFRPGTQPAAKPSVRVLGDPVDLKAGEGWLWLLTCTKCTDAAVTSGTEEGNLARIDPKTGRPEATVRVRNPGALAVGEGGVWIANFGADTVTRIDPTTLRVTATIRLSLKHAVAPGDRRFLPLYIHAGHGAVWVDTARGALVRIDPTTDRVVGYTALPPKATGDFAVGDQDIWVTEDLLGVYRVNLATSAVTARIPIGTKLRTLAVQSVAAGAGSVAVAGGWSKGIAYPDGHVEYGPTQGAAVAFIDPSTNRVEETMSIPDWSGQVVFLQSAFWVNQSNGTLLSRISRTPNRGALRIGPSAQLGPGRHFLTGGQVWTVKADGSVVRVALPSS